MIRAALKGDLAPVPTAPDPIFGLAVPAACPDVPSGLLQPRNTWKDRTAYDRTASRLVEMFHRNFEKFSGETPEDVRAAGPKE